MSSPVREYPLHVVLGALVAGLVLGPRADAAVVIGAAAAVAVAVRTGAGGAAVAVLAGLVLAAGAWGSAVRVEHLERSRLGPLAGHVVRGVVTVRQAPRAQRRGGWTALVAFRGEPVLLRVAGPGRFGGGAGPAAPAPALPVVGARLRVRAAVFGPDAYARVLRAHALLRAGAVLGAGRRGGPPGAVDRLRLSAEAALSRGGDPVATALLQGMVLGQDGALSPDVRDEVRAAGLSHLTAASGANIVLLTTFALLVAARAGLPFRVRWLAVLALIALYVPLAGAGPSIQRAGVMGAAGVVAMLAGRPAARWYALALAAAVTLLLDPRAVGDAGWQLSFAAVGALVVLGEPWSARLHARGLPRALADALAVTGAASLATAPLIAAHFGRVAPLSLVANLLVAPVVAPVMWLGSAAALAGPVLAPAAGLLDLLARPLLRWVLLVAHVTAASPGSGLRAGPLPVLGATAAVLAAVGVRTLPRVRGRLLAIPLMVATGAAGTAAWALRPRHPPPPPPRTFRVTFLDVGQGDATLLQVPRHAVLVDTGPPDGPLLARLKAAGVRSLDALVVTHAQADHDGAAAAVLAELPVGLVVDGRDGVRSALGARFAAVARARRVPLAVGRAGDQLRAGALTLRVLSPGDGPSTAVSGEDPNRRALVLEAVAGGARALLTADAESDVLAGLDLRRVDVLKVAHHGSADPGLPALLERLDPLVAGIEVGARNPYGHPAPATLRALRRVPRVVRTDRDGTVRVDQGPHGWTVHTGG